MRKPFKSYYIVKVKGKSNYLHKASLSNFEHDLENILQDFIAVIQATYPENQTLITFQRSTDKTLEKYLDKDR